MGFYSNGYGTPVPEVLTAPVAYHAVVLRRNFHGPRREVRNVPLATGEGRSCPPYLCQVDRMTTDPPMLASGRAQSRRVGHVVGPDVWGRRDVTAMLTFVISPRHYQISTANEGEKPKHEVHDVNQPRAIQRWNRCKLASVLLSYRSLCPSLCTVPQLYNLQAIICVDVKRLPPRDGMEMALQGEGAKRRRVLYDKIAEKEGVTSTTEGQALHSINPRAIERERGPRFFIPSTLSFILFLFLTHSSYPFPQRSVFQELPPLSPLHPSDSVQKNIARR
ncbi:hypothetical protein GW17_00050257 [Ensete ventricosum]|nr:hypothetical protein GW17_00050257 [Ensete ventricosum]